MGKPVVHFEVLGKDGAKLQKYYSELFDWEINADNPMDYGLVQTGGGTGIDGGVGASENGQTLVTFYVQVEDPQKYLDRAVEMGGKVVAPVTEIPGMVTFAQFADPDGNIVGIVKE